MTGYKIVNLDTLLEEEGEEFVLDYLSSFSCPLNPDIEKFIKKTAVTFAKQGIAKTHLVMASYQEEWVLVGYYTLANKYISIKDKTKGLSKTMKKRIAKFAVHDSLTKAYHITAPLIAQIGKNFTNGYNKLISGDELLKLACDKIHGIQSDLGGKIVYLECEDKPCLIEFYDRNGFCEFDTLALDTDEIDFCGKYLVQMLKYL